MPKPTGKLVRLRASRLDKEDCDVFCIPLGFRDALLDLAERLEWEATWTDDNGDRVGLSETQKSLIEQGLEALSMPCEIIINNNVTVEPSQLDVNVNTNGGGGGGCLPFELPEPVRPDGTTIETVCLPVDPENPSGDYPAENADPDTLTPPTGYPDWQSFIDSKCRAANYMVDVLLQSNEAIDNAENRVSIVLQIVQIFIEFAPPSVQKSLPWIKFLKIVEKFLDFTDDLEEVWDWVQTLSDVIEEKRDELVCIIYSAPDIVVAAVAVGTTILDELALVTAFDQLSGSTKSAFIAFYQTLVEEIVPRAFDYEWVLSIPESYQPPYNCAACGGGSPGGGWLLIPLEYDSLWAVGGSGGASGHDLTYLGSYLRATASADSPSDVAHFQAVFSAAPGAGLYMYGFHVDIANPVNVVGVGSHDHETPPAYEAIDVCTDLKSPPVPLWGLTEVSFATQFQSDTGITINVGAACNAPGLTLLDGSEMYQYGFGIESLISGQFSADFKLFMICREDII